MAAYLSIIFIYIHVDSSRLTCDGGSWRAFVVSYCQPCVGLYPFAVPYVNLLAAICPCLFETVHSSENRDIDNTGLHENHARFFPSPIMSPLFLFHRLF